ncbi:MAG TPA: DUF433 domain-containing protein [Planctomycetaceae bacterium]|nr:DUF433 domain-containing protein [Planctomycetaceae bacterium]
MSLALLVEAPPLREDDSGTIRVGKTRVTLDVVINQYNNGMTPEDLVRAFDTLDLADVHAVIAYYLRHRQEVEQYLTERSAAADRLQRKIEEAQPKISRAELLARRAAVEAENAAAGE